MNFDYTEIFTAIIALLASVVSGFVLPYLKTKLSEEKRKKLFFWVGVAVEAAEQLFSSESGKEKKEYVISFLLSKGLVFDVDEVTAMVESKVFELKNGMNV